VKPRQLIERLDDMLNPIVVKELRQAVQSRIVIAVLLLFLLIEITTLGIALMFSQPTMRPGDADFHVGAGIFLWLQGFLLVTCMVAIPIYAGARLAAERSDTNVDLLFISTLRPRSIVWGKFVSAVLLILLIFSTCAPFMLFTYLLRGIDIPTILLVLAMDFLAVLLGTQWALFMAAIPASLPVRILLGLFALVVLLMLLWTSLAGSVGMVELGAGSAADSERFWATATGILALFVGGIGLLFSWSIAVVSPPAANRAVAARLFSLLFWLASFVAACIWMRQVKDHIPMQVWMYASAALFCLQLFISINEREQWGVRVRRTIPSNVLLRVPAFLLYSGSGGGVVLALGMLALTVLWGEAAQALTPLPTGFSRPREPAILGILVTLVLYTIAYCLSAVIVRRLAGSQRIPVQYTWIIALILLGLGSILPYLIYWAMSSALGLYGEVDIEWVITNPFSAAAEVETKARMVGAPWLESSPVVFSIVWATLVTLLNLPWVVRQLWDFRPPGPVPYAALADGNGEAPAAAYLATPALRQESS
jgi:hypothetical protein